MSKTHRERIGLINHPPQAGQREGHIAEAQSLPVLPERHDLVDNVLLKVGVQRQRRITHHDPGKTIGMVDHHPQTNQATPVLTKKGDVAEIIRFEPAAHPIDL